jgi:hypothetical protein
LRVLDSEAQIRHDKQHAEAKRRHDLGVAPEREYLSQGTLLTSGDPNKTNVISPIGMSLNCRRRRIRHRVLSAMPVGPIAEAVSHGLKWRKIMTLDIEVSVAPMMDWSDEEGIARYISYLVVASRVCRLYVSSEKAEQPPTASPPSSSKMLAETVAP